MSGMQNDFIGFTFNGVHSSELGIVRTSDGSRFTENLLPTMQDKVVQIPGGDGSYYFGSYYTQKQFSLSFAFDSLTESQFRQIRALFGTKKICPLIFDEFPYKVYQVKVTGSATIKHLCFEEIKNNKIERVYRGEGSVQFVAYYPFAKSTKKFLKDYTEPNVEEWAAASGMRNKGLYDESNSSSGALDKFLGNTNNFFYVYNPGDMPTDFIITLTFNGGQIPSGSIYFTDGEERIQFDAIPAKGSDVGLQINTKLNLVEGIDATGKKTGNLYNEYITGDFFQIPQTGIGTTGATVKKLILDLSDGMGTNYNPQITYDYLYF